MSWSMSRKGTYGIILALAIMAAVLGVAFSNLASPPDRMLPEPPDFEQVDEMRDDAEVYVTVKTVLSSMNIVLAAALIMIYAGVYRTLRSDFAMGLVIMNVAMLSYAVTSNPIVQWFLGYKAIIGVGPFGWIADFFATVALGTLLWLSLE
ncbi:MAG: hypothetical protein MUE55_06290 [Thermoplasmata archaeon]|nr:hypothetical protein [Thermoplasmata archaeon]